MTAVPVFATQDPSWPLTEAAYTEGALTLDAGLALSATVLGYQPTPTTAPSITPYSYPYYATIAPSITPYFPTMISSPTPAPTLTAFAAAQNAEDGLQQAATFQGGNADWTPHIEAFTFTNGLTFELALVPAGCFQMGNDPEAGEGAADGGRQCIDAPFWIGRTEVTNAQYRACYEMGVCDRAPLDSGPDLNGSDWPVMGVDWFMAQQYTAWLSEISGMPFRLPTEAEWEYAARGPDDLIFPWGDVFDGTAASASVTVQCDRNGRDEIDGRWLCLHRAGRALQPGRRFVGRRGGPGRERLGVDVLPVPALSLRSGGRAELPLTLRRTGDARRGLGQSDQLFTCGLPGNREPDWRSNLQGFRVVSDVEPGISGHVVYRIQPGDTLYAIAARYGVTLEALMAVNGIDDPNRLVIGQRLIIPAE